MYDKDKTWIGNSGSQNLRSYFDDFITSTSITNKGWIYDADTKTLTLSGNEVAWDEIDDYASTTEKVVFTEDFNVETIPGRAFSNFSELTQIEIPECVTSIKDSTFYECKKLTTVALPATLNRIGNYAFYDCTSLETVIMHSNGTLEDKHYVLLGDSDKETAIGKYVFPKLQATLVYNPNTTWIGDKKVNLRYYFDGHTQETALDVPSVTSAPAQYYDLGGRRVSVESYRGVVVKVENGKSELMMVK